MGDWRRRSGTGGVGRPVRFRSRAAAPAAPHARFARGYRARMSAPLTTKVREVIGTLSERLAHFGIDGFCGAPGAAARVAS